ncbi:MAG: radical SAM protein [Candidatus Marinimicrobia bacterium]|nr:radical SAM protein [Candidatus Neomarinimicrobiota bacterium]
MNFRTIYIDDDLAQRLQNIGMVSAVMGGESGSQRILDEIKKEVSVEEIIYAMEALSKTTIVPKISFMVGMPGETDEEVQETYSLCIKLKKHFLKQNKIADIGVFPFRLYPGSPLFDKAINDLGLKPETRSLKEMCTAVDGDELKEGMGYKPIYKSYIKDPKKFEDMLFIYDYFIWLNQKRTNVLRNLFEVIAMFRIKNRFYHGVFIERAMVKTAREIRNSYRRIRSKWRAFKSSFSKQPEIKPEFPTDTISELQEETSSGTEFQEEMKRESLKRSFFGC